MPNEEQLAQFSKLNEELKSIPADPRRGPFTNPFSQQEGVPVDQIGERDGQVIADKSLRVDLDRSLQSLKKLPPSRERSLAITKLQEAIMWLGMDLKRLNETNPYPNSYNPSNATVEPTADGLKL